MVAAPAPWVCSGNSPHTRRFPWQPPEPSGAAISTSSSFFLFLAAPPPTHSSFCHPAEGFFSCNTLASPGVRGCRPSTNLGCKRHQQLSAAAGVRSTALLTTLRSALRVTAHWRTHGRPLGTQGTTTRQSQHSSNSRVFPSRTKSLKLFGMSSEKWSRQLVGRSPPPVQHRLCEPTAWPRCGRRGSDLWRRKRR